FFPTDLLQNYSEKMNTMWEQELFECSYYVAKDQCAPNQTDRDRMDVQFQRLVDLKLNLAELVEKNNDKMDTYEMIRILYEAAEFVHQHESIKLNLCDGENQQCKGCVKRKVDCASGVNQT